MKIHLFCSDTFYSHAPVPVALQLYRGKDGHRDITDFLQDELDLFLDSGLSFGVFSGDRVVGIGVNLLFPRYYHPHYDTTSAAVKRSIGFTTGFLNHGEGLSRLTGVDPTVSRRNYQKGRALIRHYANQPACPL